jgi:hypothetical protein
MSFNNYGSNFYNHPNNYSNNYPYDNRNYAQASVTKQEIAQIQDLELSIDTMCRVLTLGEKYALGQNVNFGAYNLSSATGDDLLRLFVREIEIFRLSYQDYVEEHGNYKFPKNLPKHVILEEIKNWAMNVPQENRKYYTCLYNLINGNYNFSLKNEIKLLKQKKKTVYKEGERANNLMNHVPYISHHTNNVAKKAEENYLQNKNYSPEVDLTNKPNQQMLNQLSKNTHVHDNEDYDDMK